MEYVCAMPAHTEVGPLMGPAAPMVVEEFTARLLADDVPQLFVAVTVILPLVAPAVVAMLAVVLLPVHPPGNVQV